MKTWYAQIDSSDLLRRFFRLQVAHTLGNGEVEILLEDGSMLKIEEGVMPPQNAGIKFHYAALEAIAEALQAHLGNALPSQAEVAILREVLTKEQGRVDAILADATLLNRGAS